MVVPLILAIGGRVAISVVLRAIAANRTRAIAKYGSSAVSKALKMGKNYKGKDKSVLQAIGKVTKKVKTAIKPKVKVKPKVKFKPTSKKQIAIQKKIQAKKLIKKPTKVTKKPPSKVTTATKTTKVKTKPSKKPTKKPSKVTTATKTTKVKTKPSKKPTKKPDKKVTTKKPVTVVKPKPKFKPGFVTGTVVGGAVPYIYNLLTKKKKSPPGIDKDKIKPKPKPKTPYPTDEDDSVKGLPYEKPIKKETASRQLYQTAKPSATFEARVRALVAQKDKLKNVDAGDGRSEYQVRMHKLKQENKKDWKKLFTIGGKLK